MQAIKPTELFEISRELLDNITKQYPKVENVLIKFAKQRLLRNVLTTSPLFRPFSKEERVTIIERFVSRDVQPGDVLIEEDAESNGFYIVLRGKLAVSRTMEDGQSMVVGELEEGEVFGEISCLHNSVASFCCFGEDGV